MSRGLTNDPAAPFFHPWLAMTTVVTRRPKDSPALAAATLTGYPPHVRPFL